MTKLLVICGSTATGKTQLAIRLAKHFGGELVSADSRQVYIGMDIGTGKDLPNKLKIKSLKFTARDCEYDLVAYDMDGVPIWLYDVVHPDEQFSVSIWSTVARAVIADILNRGKLPILVGGTGLYIQSMLKNFDAIHIAPDTLLRRQLAGKTVSELQEILQDKAPDVLAALNNSDSHNPRRLIRKIEIANHVGGADAHGETDFDAYVVGLKTDMDALYTRIDERVDYRMGAGMEGEVNSLVQKGYSFDLPSMSALGYRQWKVYIDAQEKDKEASRKRIISQWMTDEHAYARRQMTWFKKQSNIHWFDCSAADCQALVTAAVARWYTKK